MYKHFKVFLFTRKHHFSQGKNTKTDDVKLTPIYDCGSCLFPQIDEMPLMTSLHKEFYKLMLKEIKEKILDYSYNKLKTNIS